MIDNNTVNSSWTEGTACLIAAGGDHAEAADEGDAMAGSYASSRTNDPYDAVGAAVCR